MLFDSPYASRILWGAIAALLLLAFIIPRLDFTPALEVAKAEQRPDVFAEETIAAEQKLRSQRLQELPVEQAYELLPLLKARALTSAGPMTPKDIQIAVDYFDEYRPQIASQTNPASRATLRKHRNALLLEHFPRLDPKLALDALQQVRDRYIDAFHQDPDLPPAVP